MNHNILTFDPYLAAAECGTPEHLAVFISVDISRDNDDVGPIGVPADRSGVSC